MPWRPLPEASQLGEVYVLHFDQPIGTDRQRAGHYVGFAAYENGGAAKRIEQHRKGRGARLTAVARERGVGFQVAQVIGNATRRDERRLKNRGGASRYCAICRATTSEREVA